MTNEITPVAIAAAFLAHDATKRVLGPTADLIGQDIAKGYVFAKRNILRVIEIADCKLGGQYDGCGGVHPRIARRVFSESRDVEDVFAAEYFGGILASSRGNDSNDDSAAPFLKTIESLSSRQLRLHFVAHYLFGKAVSRLVAEEQESFLNGYGLRIDLDFLSGVYDESGLRWQVEEDIQQLVAVEVIGSNFLLKTSAFSVGTSHLQVKDNGLYLTFSPKGVQLFLRALGLRRGEPMLLPNVDIDFKVSTELKQQLIDNSFGHLFRNPFFKITPNLAADIEEVRFENEESVHALKERIESLESEISDLRAIIENLSSPDIDDRQDV